MRYYEITATDSHTAEPTNLSLLERAYRVFRDEKLVASQWEFSRQILGKASSYLSSMRTRGREPSLAVLERLLDQTNAAVAMYVINPQLGNPRAVSLNRSHGRFVALANAVDEELNRRKGFAQELPFEPIPPLPC